MASRLSHSVLAILEAMKISAINSNGVHSPADIVADETKICDIIRKYVKLPDVCWPVAAGVA